MKFFVGLLLLAVIGCAYSSNCNIVSTVNHKNLNLTCQDALIGQIRMEVRASYAYLQFAAYFSQDTVNLPGFAELFFKAAREERDHSIKLIDYLSMRLADDTTVGTLKDIVQMELADVDISKGAGQVGERALLAALNMEKDVTKNIHGVIEVCDNQVNENNKKEYHVSDYLTGDFLTEQYESERFFAGQLSTLKKMTKAHGNLAEFLFDKNLL